MASLHPDDPEPSKSNPPAVVNPAGQAAGSSRQSHLEDEVFKAIRELKYGVVEVVVHQGSITEIRQTRRVRIPPPDSK